jgi:hypothetical protein
MRRRDFTTLLAAWPYRHSRRARSSRRIVGSPVQLAKCRKSLCWAGPLTVSLMVEFGAGVLVLLSAGIFLAHAVAAYRTE